MILGVRISCIKILSVHLNQVIFHKKTILYGFQQTMQVPWENSLTTHLQGDIPNLYIMRCICHTCSSYSCSKLLQIPEDLACDIYNYFHMSAKCAKSSKNFLHNPIFIYSIETIYFGVNMATYLCRFNLSESNVKVFKLMCLEFYIGAIHRIYERFPLYNAIIRNIECLYSQKIEIGFQSITRLVLSFLYLVEESELEQINTDRVEISNAGVQYFWKCVMQKKYSDGKLVFLALSEFLWQVLCLPRSSATVVWVFSTINHMKTKIRNKLDTQTVSGLLHKRLVAWGDCHYFVVDKSLTDRVRKDMNDKNN
ncbi:hypothetical protein PR048_016072 [Dryococelus australis]|uniref:Uncharacterized protein n=1 Tax=Dryococelus australis TaxID=614101 RepID=A0ABQ9HJ41_9NEOP|nr:hypothetical protein PR048_016072 [Dryococelus australis]